MTKKFLDYYKRVLEKVSFDANLFNKEYHKAMNTLAIEDQAALKDWVSSSKIIKEEYIPIDSKT